jgi:hypothetical protein
VADSVEGVIYDEAQRGLALQPVLLNELRARTGTLLAVTTATTSILGVIVVKDDELGFWGLLALAAFLAVVACCLAILSPHRKWTFTEGAADMTATYCDGKRDDGSDWTIDAVRRDLALHMENHADDAMGAMGAMQGLFIAAGIGLAVEVACWLIEFSS